MYRRIIAILTLLALMALSLPAGAQDDDDDLETIDYFLTFVPNIQFAPVYLAEPYLNEAGYTMDLRYGEENVGVDLIANENADFGMISGEQVLMARAAERPVVYVYEWFQEYPIGIVIPDTTDAETVADLEGLKVGVPGRFGATYSGLTAILSANDLTEQDIDLETIGFAAPDVVCVGGVDASAIYVNNEPLQIQRRADAGDCGDITGVSVLRVSDFADIVSNGIVTSEAMIEQDPDLVRVMLAAYDNALRDSINNPAQAYLDSVEFVEGLPINDEFEAFLQDASADFEALAAEEDITREMIAEQRQAVLDEALTTFDSDITIQFEVFIATIALWDADELGFTEPESWEETLAIVNQMGSLVAEVEDLEAAYTNDYLP
jgi:NitT/TauT family transport system substrate-binding protein